MIDGISLAIFLSFSSAAFFTMLAIKALSAPAPQPVSPIQIRPEWHAVHGGDRKQLSHRFDAWFTRLVARTGLKIDRYSTMLILGATSLLAGIACFVADLPAYLQILIGMAVFGSGLTILYCLHLARVKKFSAQFPAALELLARSVRSGEDFESAIVSVSKNFEEPISNEFRWCQQQIELGLSPADAIGGLAHRIPTMDVQLFAHTIAVHRNLGGRLSDSLERLSSVIRDRSAQIEKIKSITGIGRFAVFAILFMAVFVLIYLSWMHPEYIAKLYSARLGRQMMIYAAISEFIGIVWAFLTLKSEL